MNLPSFAYEQAYWQESIAPVAGIDEVGMGALAGPVVAAAVIFDVSLPTDVPSIIRDSKSLSAAQRLQGRDWIMQHAAAWSIAQATVEEITRHNIRRASHLAMRRAVVELTIPPQVLLIDGTAANIHPTIPASALVNGDRLSVSIAAASILAKVWRDQAMTELAEEFPVYGFEAHKGYGSASHLTALRRFGACPHHRPSYAPVAEVIANLTRSTHSINSGSP